MSKFLDGTGLSDLITKIKNAFVAKADTTVVTGVGVDSTPIAGSTNLVMSGGVKAALDVKQDTLVSGQNIKTINGESILGEGDIEIESGDEAVWGNISGTLADQTDLANALGAKYEKPSGGIPKTDLASAVQTSLGKADTALQSFTETDPTVPSWAKAQNPPQEIFWATYGVTTAAEIDAGLANGKMVLLNGFNNNGRIYVCVGKIVASSSYNFYVFVSQYNDQTSFVRVRTDNNVWASGTWIFEQTGNKVSDIAANSTSTSKYPNTKAVADYVASKELSDLADVSDTAPTDGQALLWDGTNEEWKPGTVQGGGGSVTDVTVGGTSVVNQQGVAEVPEIPEAVVAQELSIDSTPTANSTNLVTSGGVASALSGKQATLVSGTNIKTINSTSLLGSGDIAISANTPKATTIPAGGLLPNVYYALGTLTGSVTLSMASPTASGILNQYFFTFDTGSTAPTITWSNLITSWFGGSAPTINSSKHYEVSVVDGVGVCMEV